MTSEDISEVIKELEHVVSQEENHQDLIWQSINVVKQLASEVPCPRCIKGGHVNELHGCNACKGTGKKYDITEGV